MITQFDFVPYQNTLIQNKTALSRVSHLLSLADKGLLGEHVTNFAPLAIFSRKVTDHGHPVYIFGITANTSNTFHQWAQSSLC